jgi:hypothetical protein
MSWRQALVAAVTVTALGSGWTGTAGSGTGSFPCGFVIDPPIIEPGASLTVIGSGLVGPTTLYLDPDPGPFEEEVTFAVLAGWIVLDEIEPDPEGAFMVVVELPSELPDGPHSLAMPCDAEDESVGIALNVLIGGGPPVPSTTSTTAPPPDPPPAPPVPAPADFTG